MDCAEIQMEVLNPTFDSTEVQCDLACHKFDM